MQVKRKVDGRSEIFLSAPCPSFPLELDEGLDATYDLTAARPDLRCTSLGGLARRRLLPNRFHPFSCVPDAPWQKPGQYSTIHTKRRIYTSELHQVFDLPLSKCKAIGLSWLNANIGPSSTPSTILTCRHLIISQANRPTWEGLDYSSAPSPQGSSLDLRRWKHPHAQQRRDTLTSTARLKEPHPAPWLVHPSSRTLTI